MREWPHPFSGYTHKYIRISYIFHFHWFAMKALSDKVIHTETNLSYICACIHICAQDLDYIHFIRLKMVLVYGWVGTTIREAWWNNICMYVYYLSFLLRFLMSLLINRQRKRCKKMNITEVESIRRRLLEKLNKLFFFWIKGRQKMVMKLNEES